MLSEASLDTGIFLEIELEAKLSDRSNWVNSREYSHRVNESCFEDAKMVIEMTGIRIFRMFQLFLLLILSSKFTMYSFLRVAHWLRDY